MLPQGLRRHVSEIASVARDLVLLRYPPFVTGGPLPRGHVPVFCFHSIEPGSFQHKVEHLARNGYVTLSSAEYAAVLAGEHAAPERAAVLTFDDGRSSLRTVGLPIMRRYGMKGIVFVIPGRVASRPGALPPTWDDVDAGRVSSEALVAREMGPDALLTWEEIEDLARSGLIDVESHSYSHGLVHTAPRLAGFLTPDLRTGFGPLDVPLIREDSRDLFAPEVALGTPLLRSQPRLTEARRFYEDPAVRRDCRALAADAGETLFSSPAGLRALWQCFGNVRLTGRWETREEHQEAIRRELALARTAIAERLGRDTRQLCLPWHAYGATARRLATAVGYRLAFCGRIGAMPISLAGSDPMAIARVGEDYVELLPGQGRGSLSAVLTRKWKRRLRAMQAETRSS
jgi:peptidoglycan/xylan/chitin deacetylase (PgdA/CDA1 family)